MLKNIWYTKYFSLVIFEMLLQKPVLHQQNPLGIIYEFLILTF